MKVKQSRRFLYIGIAAVVALLLVMFALSYVLNAAVFREQLIARASLVSGMDVVIDDPLRLRFFPGLQVVLTGVHLARDGADVVAAARVEMDMDLLPLLRRQARIKQVLVEDPVFAISRDQNGNFNFERRVPYEGRLPGMSLEQIAITGGVIHFADARSGAEYAAEDCDVDIHGFMLTDRISAEQLQGQSIDAALACATLRRNTVSVTDVQVTVTGADRVFRLEPLTLNMFEAIGSGSAQVDFVEARPRYRLDYALPGFQSEAFFAAFAPGQTIEGSLDFAAMLQTQGSTATEMKQALAGQLSLHGAGLTLRGVDLDEEFSQYESSQNFNLVDMGAFFFAGPLGLAVTKGYDFAGIFQDGGSSSEIRALLSEWTITNGLAQAQDVALATPENRVVMQGGLDFQNGEFVDLTVALVDSDGCAMIEQKILGSFQNPQIDKPGILRTLAGPAISLVQQGIDLLEGDECEPFYTGSLPAQ